MGVNGLWTVVAPTARPTKLETLNRKKLAVDASIWIYQFLKAVRDKEGNALRNSHVVGFFRRICKLLYFGIQPVFVFDGGAPVLKRETIRGRARRREGRREDATKTAGKLLALQVTRAAEEEDKRRRERANIPKEVEEELPSDQELVYVDELGMSNQERQAGRGFRKKDQYHLPDLDVNIAEMGMPDDPRIMSQLELEEYAKQFHSGEDINLYDFSKIDFDSPFFLSLPPGDRYNILNAARLRSRLRMGYSKEQLDGMFPDRMAFSRFQIERVKERNELTQRLMHINGMTEGEWNQGGRIAGERGKEYILVKNDGAEGGWALGVVSGRRKEDAIDLEDENTAEDDDHSSEQEDEFEDVAVEGLNRIPKTWQRKAKSSKEADHDFSYEEAAEAIAKKRTAVYDARRKAAGNLKQSIPAPLPKYVKPTGESDLFVAAEDQDGSGEDELFEDVEMGREGEEDDLQKAIAMSLEQSELNDDAVNHNASEKVDDDDGVDIQDVLAASRKTKPQTKNSHKQPEKKSNFDGPLPFESMNLGQSLLGKKKAKKIEEDLSGGFERDVGDEKYKRQKNQPLPDWFGAAAGDGPTGMDSPQHADDVVDDDHIYGQERSPPRRRQTKEVIDLEAEDMPGWKDPPKNDRLYDGDDEYWATMPEEDQVQDPLKKQLPNENEALDDARQEEAAKEREKRYELARQIAAVNEDEVDKSEDRLRAERAPEKTRATKPVAQFSGPVIQEAELPQPSATAAADDDDDDELFEWSESETQETPALADVNEAQPEQTEKQDGMSDLAKSQAVKEAQEDDEVIFEDVDMQGADLAGDVAGPADQLRQDQENEVPSGLLLVDEDQGESLDQHNDKQTEQEEYFSDSDEEIMRQLAVEAEEHARFASELNNRRNPTDAVRDYETELKQLRNQQKKDRRDADEVTQVMVQECQALLRLFGLPYITAPMEAEAQCAELVHLGLVDGIVTDDSDIFLFGGTRIYKNMFNAARFVECYLSADLEKEYALDRRKLIRFAHLLGSDYTEGIPGIGPVTALEIISDFPTLDDFKTWCSKVQLGKPSDLEGQLTTPFRRKFKNAVQKRLFLPSNFPDLRVDNAYLDPDVDSTPEDFQWGVPDLDRLRSFLMATIGWSQDRTDEILVPVIRDMNKRGAEGTQSNITQFFTGGVGVGARPGPAVEGSAPRNRTGKESGRMASAYTRLRGEAEKKKKRNMTSGLEAGTKAGDEKSTDAADDQARKIDKRPRLDSPSDQETGTSRLDEKFRTDQRTRMKRRKTRKARKTPEG